MARVEPALLMPDLLAVTREVKQLISADGSIIEAVQQANACKLADGMRQRVNADAQFANGIGLLKEFAVDAAGAQHQCRGETADAATNDDRFHGPYSTRCQGP